MSTFDDDSDILALGFQQDVFNLLVVQDRVDLGRELVDQLNDLVAAVA